MSATTQSTPSLPSLFNLPAINASNTNKQLLLSLQSNLTRVAALRTSLISTLSYLASSPAESIKILITTKDHQNSIEFLASAVLVKTTRSSGSDANTLDSDSMLPPPYEAKLASEEIVQEVLICAAIRRAGSGPVRDWSEQVRGMREVLGEMERVLEEMVVLRLVEDGAGMGVLGMEGMGVGEKVGERLRRVGDVRR